MRHLSDEELAKYFDDGTDSQEAGAPKSGWSLDDAFANPKVGSSDAGSPDLAAAQVPAMAAGAATVHESEVGRPNIASRASYLPPLADDSLTWTGRDAQFEKSNGLSGKPIMMMVGAIALCAIVFVLFGAESGPVTGNLPQIGQ